MSVSKLLSRIVAPNLDDLELSRDMTLEAKIHDKSYGITGDPIVAFACVFSAIIHDAEHRGKFIIASGSLLLLRLQGARTYIDVFLLL